MDSQEITRTQTPASDHQPYTDLRSHNERRAKLASVIEAQRRQRDERMVQFITSQHRLRHGS